MLYTYCVVSFISSLPVVKSPREELLLTQKGERGTMGKKYSPPGAQRSEEIANGPHIKIAVFLRESRIASALLFPTPGCIIHGVCLPGIRAARTQRTAPTK